MPVGISYLRENTFYGVSCPGRGSVADVDWIEEAALQGWPILMKDKRIHHRPAEIGAVVTHKPAVS